MNVTIIQIVLTLCIALIAIYMYIRLRSGLFDLILIGLFFIAGIFFVLFPETTNKIAHWVGVSKGANLLLYSAILFLLFLILKLYSRLRRIEQKFTELVRNKSIEEAEELQKKT
jgi:small membrane protein